MTKHRRTTEGPAVEYGHDEARFRAEQLAQLMVVNVSAQKVMDTADNLAVFPAGGGHHAEFSGDQFAPPVAAGRMRGLCTVRSPSTAQIATRTRKKMRLRMLQPSLLVIYNLPK